MSEPSKEFVALDRASTEIMLNKVIKDLDDNTVKGIVYILTSQYRPEILKELVVDITEQPESIVDISNNLIDAVVSANDNVEQETKPYTYPPRVRDAPCWPFMRCKNIARKIVKYDEQIPRSHYELLVFLAEKFKMTVDTLKVTDPRKIFDKNPQFEYLRKVIDRRSLLDYY